MSTRSLPIRLALNLAMALLGVLLAGPSDAQENLYENAYGLTVGAPAPVNANAGINPNGSGQVLYGAYYDVRPFDGDAQHVNIQIRNGNTNESDLPPCTPLDFEQGNDGSTCYNPLGGVLAKIRFRDFRRSKELLDFNIALSCGEVWAGRVAVKDGRPAIFSVFPVVTLVTEDEIETDDVVGNGQVFSILNAPLEDIGRGYFEVIGMESLPCEPAEGQVFLTGNTWERLDCEARSIDCTPTNALSAEVFVVRPAAGVSHEYNTTAISRFVYGPFADNAGGGSITPIDPTGTDDPTVADCVNIGTSSQSVFNSAQCLSQVNLGLARSRLLAQYDIESVTAGTTDLVVTLPTKGLVCGNDVEGPAAPPFQCQTRVGLTVAGEEIGCRVWDRLEHDVQPDQPIFSPATDEDCLLPFELTILGIAQTADAVTPRADAALLTGSLPAPESGWVELDLASNSDGTVSHGEVVEDGLGGAELNVQGVGVYGYEGLPAVALVLQEFQNGNVGGTYGDTVAALGESRTLTALP